MIYFWFIVIQKFLESKLEIVSPNVYDKTYVQICNDNVILNRGATFSGLEPSPACFVDTVVKAG